MEDAEKNYNKFQDNLEKAEVLGSKIEAVLLEMEKGVGSDYKQREGFIVQQKKVLGQIQQQIRELREDGSEFEPRIE